MARSWEQQRRDNVRPEAWQQPIPKARYHLVVIGTGTGGLVSAAIAVGLGARVAIVERHEMGGDCLNVGCVPSKALIRAARAWHDARTAAARFGGPAANGHGDFAAVMARMQRIRAALSRVDSAGRFRELGVDVFFGDAQFVDDQSVAVTNAAGANVALRFHRAIVATGGRAAVPPIDGIADSGYLTNETIFSLDRLPARLIVVGGGAIGCELAQTFARLGSAVTLLDAGARILPRDDADAARVVHASFVADGITVNNSVQIIAARRLGDAVTLTCDIGGARSEITGDALLLATGRTPNIGELGLDAAHIAHDVHGIWVNDRLRTTNARVFAIGDCASRHQFTHSADAQARLAVPNALFFGLGGGKASSLVMPWCTYTSPEVAHTGMTAEEAEAAGPNVKTVTISLHDVDRAVLDDEDAGFLRIHLKAGSDRILGATLVAEHAGETISELTAAIVNGIGLDALGKTIHPYPTQAEAIRKAADAHRRERLTPFAKRLFAAFFRAFG